jgi:hypothetical protein
MIPHYDPCHANWWRTWNSGSFSTFFTTTGESGSDFFQFWWENVLKEIPIKYPFLVGRFFLYTNPSDNTVGGFTIEPGDFTRASLMNFLVFQRRPCDLYSGYSKSILSAVKNGLCDFRTALFVFASLGLVPSKEDIIRIPNTVGGTPPTMGHMWLTTFPWKWLSNQPIDPNLKSDTEGYIGIDRNAWFDSTKKGSPRDLFHKFVGLLGVEKNKEPPYLFFSLRVFGKSFDQHTRTFSGEDFYKALEQMKEVVNDVYSK